MNTYLAMLMCTDGVQRPVFCILKGVGSVAGVVGAWVEVLTGELTGEVGWIKLCELVHFAEEAEA